MRNRIQGAKHRRIAGRRRSFNIDHALSPPDEPVPHLAMSVHRAALPSHARKRRSSSSGDQSLFIWTIFILLLIGFAIFCWIGSIYIFGHPEKAFNYSLLLKLKKIEPLKKFEITLAPRGEFLTADQLLEKFGSQRPAELADTNANLLRNYVRNYKQMVGLVPYLSGTYTIIQADALTASDLFPSGVAVLAQSNDNPSVLLEHAFPAPADTVPYLLHMFQTGNELNFEKRPDRAIDISSVVHVEYLENGQIKVTGVPLVYGTYTSTSSDGPGAFSLSPPDQLNLVGGPPLLSNEQTQSSLAAWTSTSNQKQLVSTRSASAKNNAAGQEFIRVAPAQSADGRPRPSPPPPIFEKERELQVRKAIAVIDGVPMLTPSGVEGVPLEGTTAEVAAPTPEVPKAIPVVTSTGRNWQTYAPGQAPKARTADISEISALANTGIGNERVYLKGDFVVRVSGNNRAVLRTQGSDAPVRVIVDYPAGFALPAQETTLSRDAQRPLLITNVQRAPDGTINIFALEITKP